jgi:hypothetical protein
MLNFRLTENGAEVEIVENGLSHWKTVDIKDLIKVLNESVMKPVGEVISSPLMPTGTIGYKEFLDRNAYTVLMYRAPRVASISFEEREYKVGYPAIIFQFTVTNQVLTDTNMYAVKDHLLKPETELFRYPYFNVHNGGRVCMGNNKIAIEEAWHLHKAPDILSSLPGNNGLSISNQSGLIGDSLLKEVEEKPFPEDWLTPMGKTLKQLF